ncbi:GDSL esterase/lipase At4g01130-like [Physcomitrium patens]|uniref:Uncharacterized protein n=1 Tax=Physcomitrium patens TaxID=3218 RepID=A0A7I4BLN7_PHYPA
MDLAKRNQRSVHIWAVKALLLLVSYNVPELNAKALPNCSYPAVYSFGDSLTDTGNSIAAFPDQFAQVELDPYGFEFPMHAADRYSDGKLPIDYLEFGVRGRPNYPWLRSIAGDFEYGTNFASAGGSSRNSTGWKPDHGFNTPFSLNAQVRWFERYTVRLLTYYYYKNSFGDSAVVQTTLPAENSLNQSLYMMYAGFQYYFFDLYEKKLTPGQGLDTVPDVVDAINTAIESLVGLYATEVLVVNLPPLGCIPSLLTLFSSQNSDEYDTYGYLKNINLISTTHNKILQDTVTDLRAKFTNVTFYLGNLHDVYIDILKSPESYNVTKPL